MFILKVSVEDKDDGLNRELRYVFVIFLDMFCINVILGVIYMVKKIEISDWELFYFVVVLVIDWGVF